MHIPDRVHRQFELTQHIHDYVPRMTRVDPLKYRMRDWSVKTDTYIIQWEDRVNQVQNQRQHHTFFTKYMRWY